MRVDLDVDRADEAEPLISGQRQRCVTDFVGNEREIEKKGKSTIDIKERKKEKWNYAELNGCEEK